VKPEPAKIDNLSSTLTAAEQAELDKIIAKHGMSAILHYLAAKGDRNMILGDDKRVSPDETSTALTPVEQAEIDGYLYQNRQGAIGEYLDDLLRKNTGANTNRVLKYLGHFVSRGAGVNTPPYGHLKNPLYAALRMRDIEIVKFLIAAGADVNAKSDNGETPLHTAAWEGNIAIVQFLVSKGADANVKMRYIRGLNQESQMTPADYAKERKHTAIAGFLRMIADSDNREDTAPVKETAKPSVIPLPVKETPKPVVMPPPVKETPKPVPQRAAPPPPPPRRAMPGVTTI